MSLPTNKIAPLIHLETRLFMKMDAVQGDVQVLGQEGTIGVYDVCSVLSGSSQLEPALPSGTSLAHVPTIVKRVDISSPMLHTLTSSGRRSRKRRSDT